MQFQNWLKLREGYGRGWNRLHTPDDENEADPSPREPSVWSRSLGGKHPAGFDPEYLPDEEEIPKRPTSRYTPIEDIPDYRSGPGEEEESEPQPGVDFPALGEPSPPSTFGGEPEDQYLQNQPAKLRSQEMDQDREDMERSWDDEHPTPDVELPGGEIPSRTKETNKTWLGLSKGGRSRYSRIGSSGPTGRTKGKHQPRKEHPNRFLQRIRPPWRQDAGR